MNLLTDNVKKVYQKYLVAAFGSALIGCIYGLVDTAVVGQYHGPEGAATMAVIAPIWNILYSLGLFSGIGGAVLFSRVFGQTQNKNKANEYFSISLLLTIMFSIIIWGVLLIFEEHLFTLFGADEALMILAKRYLVPIKMIVPVFLMNKFLIAFLTNDSNPVLATKAVLMGGLFNVVGDYLFVFVFDMGISGAGLATAGGAILTLAILTTHFFSKKNTLRIVKISHLPRKLLAVLNTGFSTFFIDISMGIVTMLFNRQIMIHLGTNALSIYGIIVNIGTFVQCCGYGIGQAAQPLLSVNYGAKKIKRTIATLKLSLSTVTIISIGWAFVTLMFPTAFVYLFMAPTEAVLNIAPFIIRSYSLSFLLLPFNIFATYYFQSTEKPGISFAISVTRGLVLSGGLIILLPTLFNANTIWFAMPITELLVAIPVGIIIFKSFKQNDSIEYNDVENN
ncbi:MATE family efflux transporter [Marinilactibacillus sp. XAAS-LB27]|uniref:MATE family efflux transporter n=1 Tax=Marinilactibacillus sp. XAAS-LB27 TaxID=3114538 RepID=UPI002E19C0BE|nr:MATE family efflux transporter [Marinilactibacillus sp. XAAS-LB27]